MTSSTTTVNECMFPFFKEISLKRQSLWVNINKLQYVASVGSG